MAVESTFRHPVSRWLAGPIRGRTTAVAVVVVSTALTLGGAGLLRILSNNLNHSISDTARLRAADVATLVQKNSLPQPLAFRGEDSGLVQVVDSGGHVIASTANLINEPPIASYSPPTARPEVHTVNHASFGDGQRFRVVAQRVIGKSGFVTIYTASSLDATDEAIASVRIALLLGIPLLVLLVGATTWLLTKQVLEPVEGIRRQVLKITAGGLDRRVPVPTSGDEISLLAQTMNDMLDRLETAAKRQSRFVADASHELRSPLTAMRATMEINLAHPESADWQATTADLLVDQDRLERIVADLLSMAKSGAGVAPAALHSIDLSQLVTEELERRAPGRVPIRLQIASDVVVIADPHQLTQVVRNLVDNADRHATSSVDVALDNLGGIVRLRVIDDGPGIGVDDRQRIFEPFTRLDDARDRDHGGSGLGLAIVSDLVHGFEGTVSVTQEAGTCFEVLLPSPTASVKQSSKRRKGIWKPAPIQFATRRRAGH